MGIRTKVLILFSAVLLVAVVALELALSASLGETVRAQIADSLTQQATLLARDASEKMARGPVTKPEWDAWTDARGRATTASDGAHVSILGLDGVLWGDSQLNGADLTAAENAARSPELQRAVAGTVGSDERRSQPLGQPFLYVAVPVRGASSEPQAVVRVGESLQRATDTLSAARRTLRQTTMAVAVLALVAVLLGAHWMTGYVRRMTDVARAMATGNVTARVRSRSRDELGQLGGALDQLADSLLTAWHDLRRERDTFGGVLTGMREGILLVGRDDRVALANPALREMLLLDNPVGKTPLEVLRSAELRHLIDAAARDGQAPAVEVELGELRPRRVLIFAQRLNLGSDEVERARNAPSGETQQTQLTREPVGLPTAQSPDLGGVLVVFIDVTELRQLESVRRDFVANVSHELRTPIAAVRSGAETLRALAGTDAAATEEFAAMIERNAERLQRLVDDLLDLSRIEARQLRLALSPCRVADVVASVATLLAGEALTRKVTISNHVAATHQVLADPKALEQILTNLIENALKHGGGGVTVASQATNDTITIAVSDTGPGIDARHLPRLFERFYRVDPSRSRAAGGTGLGLAIVKHLAEALGGTVSVDSTPGRGTTFRVTLPAANG